MGLDLSGAVISPPSAKPASSDTVPRISVDSDSTADSSTSHQSLPTSPPTTHDAASPHRHHDDDGIAPTSTPTPYPTEVDTDTDTGTAPPPPSMVREEAPAILLPNQAADNVGHLAVDIGGSLVKIVFFTPTLDPEAPIGSTNMSHHNKPPCPPIPSNPSHKPTTTTTTTFPDLPTPRPRTHHLGGRLHFVKFETAKLEAGLDFIQKMGLHLGKPIRTHTHTQQPTPTPNNPHTHPITHSLTLT